MKTGRVLIGIMMLSLASVAWAQKVDVDFNNNMDFSKFKTHAWMESKHPAKGLWPLRIVDGIDKQLQAKGLKKVDASEHPDLKGVYNSGIKEKTTVARIRLRLRVWAVVGLGRAQCDVSDVHRQRSDANRGPGGYERQGNGMARSGAGHALG